MLAAQSIYSVLVCVTVNGPSVCFKVREGKDYEGCLLATVVNQSVIPNRLYQHIVESFLHWIEQCCTCRKCTHSLSFLNNIHEESLDFQLVVGYNTGQTFRIVITILV